MLSISSRIWTCVAVSISHDDNHCTTGTWHIKHFIAESFLCTNWKYDFSTMKEKCPPGVCSAEGEYITHRTCSYGNDLYMYPATTCDCGRKFNSLRGSRIHKARWCKQRNSPTGECKSNDGPMNQVYPPQYSWAHCWASASWRHSLQAKNLVAQE